MAVFQNPKSVLFFKFSDISIILNFLKGLPSNAESKQTMRHSIRDHPFKTSACLRGGGVWPCADGQKVTVHKDQKSPS